MDYRKIVQGLSTGGQLLSDAPEDVTRDLILIIKIAALDEDDLLATLERLCENLKLYQILYPETLITDIAYQEHTGIFDVKIDAVGREIISLTVDDLRLLADMPMD